MMETSRANAKLCECGCGQPTPLSQTTDKNRGYIKGEPVRFRKGHWLRGRTGKDALRWKGGRTLKCGYVMVHMSDHPRADLNGYVREHVLIAEAALGKSLPP